MDWQQPVALLVVAVAVFALIRRSLRNRGKSCPDGCSCPGDRMTQKRIAGTLEKPAGVSYLTKDKGGHS